MMLLLMMPTVRRHITGRHLSEAQHVLDDRRQALRLPDQIVRQRRRQHRRRFECGRHRSAGQLQLGAAKAQLILGTTFVHAEIGVAHPFHDQHVLGARMPGGLVEGEIGVLARQALIEGDGHAVMEPVHGGGRLGSYLAFEVGAQGDFRVNDAGGGLDLRRDCEFAD